MALKWQYTSDLTTQARYATGLSDMLRVGTSSALTFTTGPSGTFGTTGKYLDMSTAATKILWPGGDNGPVGSTAISILWRLIPRATGAPVANHGFFQLGNAAATLNGYGTLAFSITTAAKLRVYGGTTASGSNWSNNNLASAGFTFTVDVPTDLWYVWNGSAGNATVWQGQNGVAASQIATITMDAANTGWIRAAMSDLSCWDAPNATYNTGFHINEIAVFDSVEVPSSYGARTNFVNTSVFSGYSYTNVTASQLKIGDSVTQAGVTVVGTYDGSERYTDVPAGSVASGYAYAYNSTTNNRTGTLPSGASQASVDAIATKVNELHAIAGLTTGTPMTVTPTRRTAGSVDLAITGDGVSTTTVTRQ